MAAHGKLEPFHVGQDDWESYKECLQQYFVANDKEDAVKQKKLGVYAWTEHLQHLRNQENVNIAKVILEHLRHYYSPKPSTIVQCCKFNMQC